MPLVFKFWSVVSLSLRKSDRLTSKSKRKNNGKRIKYILIVPRLQLQLVQINFKFAQLIPDLEKLFKEMIKLKNINPERAVAVPSLLFVKSLFFCRGGNFQTFLMSENFVCKQTTPYK